MNKRDKRKCEKLYKSSTYWQVTLFGTMGSQVQILPLRARKIKGLACRHPSSSPTRLVKQGRSTCQSSWSRLGRYRFFGFGLDHWRDHPVQYVGLRLIPLQSGWWASKVQRHKVVIGQLGSVPLLCFHPTSRGDVGMKTLLVVCRRAWPFSGCCRRRLPWPYEAGLCLYR